jgi:hypothetical protein
MVKIEEGNRYCAKITCIHNIDKCCQKRLIPKDKKNCTSYSKKTKTK